MENKAKIIPPSDDKCPVRASLTLLSGKWTLLILFQINENVMRYSELKRAIPGISEKMLIQELNMLVESKLVSKKAYPEIPPKVEYSLTDFGKTLIPVISAIGNWGDEYQDSLKRVILKGYPQLA